MRHRERHRDRDREIDIDIYVSIASFSPQVLSAVSVEMFGSHLQVPLSHFPPDTQVRKLSSAKQLSPAGVSVWTQSIKVLSPTVVSGWTVTAGTKDKGQVTHSGLWVDRHDRHKV